MNITLHYYAMLREKAGTPIEILETESTSLQDLFKELDQRHGFHVDPARIRVAQNSTMTTWDAPLSDGDHITFIPPTAGG